MSFVHPAAGRYSHPYVSKHWRHNLAGGLVKEAAWQARERGILFEAADARAHFSFDVGEEAVKEGFLPDLIGPDLTAFSMYQRPTSFNLAMQVSKYTYMGVDIYEVIRRCTELPAKIMECKGKSGRWPRTKC